MTVYVVEIKDYGDNGWSIEKIFGLPESADKYMEDNPLKFGYYYELEEFEVE